jgi:hypothetical protein
MQPRDLHQLFSEKCAERTVKDEDGVADMSDHFIFIVGCIGDKVELGTTAFTKL